MGTYKVGTERTMSCGCNSLGKSCEYHEGYEKGLQVGVIDEVNKQYERGILHGVLLTVIAVSLIVLY